MRSQAMMVGSSLYMIPATGASLNQSATEARAQFRNARACR